MIFRNARAASLLVSLAAVVCLPACSKRGYLGTMLPNARPVVTITQWPAAGTTGSTYAYELSWAAHDPDGAVVGYRWAVDPPAAAGADTAWVLTSENRRQFVFPLDSAVIGADGVARRQHVVAVEALDDRGDWSGPATIAFDATTIAPTVRFVSPVPSGLGSRYVGGTVSVAWTGEDLDGVGDRRPVAYRYRLFSASSDPPVNVVAAFPETLAGLFGPNYSTWDSLPGTRTSLTLTDLTLRQRHLLAIVATDEAGVTTSRFRLDENLLDLYADPTFTLGPQLTLYNDGFSYQYPSGGWFVDPSSFILQDFAAGTPITLKWRVRMQTGGYVRGYRWAVDPVQLDDFTPRTDENTDLAHWSQWTTATSLNLPAFEPRASGVNGPHWFYLLAEDDIGYRSLAVVQFTCYSPTFTRPLLVVNDTGFNLDKPVSGGCVDRPRGSWPTAAELDTFLYATGGKPWRCYPAGTTTTPGLFAGYDVDTIGTRTMTLGGLSLGLLDRHRNVIWMTDIDRARRFTGPAGSVTSAMPMLRSLTQPGVANPLVVWLQQGGRLWVQGGGIAYATTIDYKPARGTPDNIFATSTGELAPGHFMFTFPHWRSEITLNTVVRAGRTPNLRGDWAGAPDYSRLPVLLAEKSTATDPLPPYRTTSDYFMRSFIGEYVSKPLSVIETDDTPEGTARSVLDTLFTTQGGVAGPGWPIGTLYHGRESGPVLCTGFPLWYFQRPQAIELLDWVLQDWWGMTRRPEPR
ncbi:MAG: hypothetical protein U0704_06310 [Candidatus Eisenbacteria bacterium]